HGERGNSWATLPAAGRSEVGTAYRVYKSAVETWQQARALTAFTATWEHDLEIAAQRYIEASLEFGQAMLREGGIRPPPFDERGSAIAPYRRWLACYAPVLQGTPSGAADLTCERMRAMRSDLTLGRDALLTSAGARPRRPHFRLLQVHEYLSDIVEDLVVGFVGLQDEAFAALLNDGLEPTPVSRPLLNEPFRPGANGPLAFRCAADWIDADLGLRLPLASADDNDCDGAVPIRTEL